MSSSEGERRRGRESDRESGHRHRVPISILRARPSPSLYKLLMLLSVHTNSSLRESTRVRSCITVCIESISFPFSFFLALTDSCIPILRMGIVYHSQQRTYEYLDCIYCNRLLCTVFTGTTLSVSNCTSVYDKISIFIVSFQKFERYSDLLYLKDCSWRITHGEELSLKLD